MPAFPRCLFALAIATAVSSAFNPPNGFVPR
jgi:hypothetical protein